MLAAGNSVKGKAFSIPIVRSTICIFPYDAKSLADTCYYMHYQPDFEIEKLFLPKRESATHFWGLGSCCVTFCTSILM